MIHLKIKLLDGDWGKAAQGVYNDIKSYKDDAGFDLYCPDQLLLEPKETTLIKMGIACEMTDDYLPTSYMLVPRSSIYKTPLRMANSIGIIDAGYRGEIMAAVDNTSDDDYMVSPGERLFQLVHPTLYPIHASVESELSDTERGDGGFWSTGK